MNTRRFSAFGFSVALHLLTALCLLWVAGVSISRSNGARTQHQPMPAFAAAPAEDPALPGLNPGSTPSSDVVTPSSAEAPRLAIAGFTFDVTKVRDHAALLFPFLTPGLRLEYFGLSNRRHDSRVEWHPASRATADADDDAPPLALSDSAMQSIIDAAWSRRDRWTAFAPIAALTGRYSASAGHLPNVLHAYLGQDGLQPYVDTTIRDPRLWAELGIAADHLPFIGFISRYASAHPSTEATTELLLLLDKCAQASLDALVTLVQTNLADLQWTRRSNRGAFDVITQVQTYYRVLLAGKGLSSVSLARYYDTVRLGVLNGVVRTTPHGYRASDAKYLIGAIYWRQGRTADAMDIWRDMSPEATDSYVAASTNILTALRAPAGAGQVNDINRALDREHGRWVSESFDRLRRFGYRFDTF